MSFSQKPRRSRRVTWVLALLVIVGIAFVVKVVLSRNKASPAYARSHGLPIPVRTAPVERRSIEKMIGATAVTMPSERLPIRAGIHPRLSLEEGASSSAWLVVKTVQVRPGDEVHAGDVLVELDDSEQQFAVGRAESALVAAEAELAAVRLSVAASGRLRDLELASARADSAYRTAAAAAHTKIFEAMTQLSGKDVVAAVSYYEAQIKQAEAQYQAVEVKERLQKAEDAMTVGSARDEAELARAQALWKTARANLELSRKDLEYCRVKSPVDGFIAKLTASPGEIFPITSPLGEVVKLDPLQVQVDFPQERIDEAAIGNAAEVIVDSYPRETFQGKVVGILPQAQTDSRVVPMIVELPNAKSRVRAGITGFVRLQSTVERVAVPSTAVLQRGPQSYVFRVEQGRAQIRNVIPGPVLENGVLEITAGLAPGDEVVVFGSSYLRDGDRVNTNWKDWTRRE